MSYIGSTPTTQSFVAGTDYFNGTGSQVAFTLSRSVNSVNDIEVIVNNVEQIPSGYLVSGTTLTFSAAPSAGTSNVYVRYLSTTNLSLAIPAGTSASFNTLAYTGTLTGGTGVVNLGSGQVYKDASGNVGIGMTPTNFGNGYTVLQVANASNGGMLYLTNTANEGGRIYGNGAGLTYDAFSATYHAFNTNGTERARIDSSGNLLVGTTSVSAISGEATAKFQAAGNAVFGNAVASTNLTVTLNGVVNKASRIGFAESGGIKWLIGNGAASENGVFEVYSNTTGTGVQLGRNATSWSAASDERLKTTLVPFENAATKVAALRAGTARYLTDVDSMSRSFLSAQSVQAVLPEAVDANTDEQATLSLRYTDVIPLLVAAIQEQQTLITALTARITALEAK